MLSLSCHGHGGIFKITDTRMDLEQYSSSPLLNLLMQHMHKAQLTASSMDEFIG